MQIIQALLIIERLNIFKYKNLEFIFLSNTYYIEI